jgi:hypothetical protein
MNNLDVIRLVSLFIIFLSLLFGIIAMINADYIDGTSNVVVGAAALPATIHLGLFSVKMEVAGMTVSVPDVQEYFDKAWKAAAAFLIIETLMKGVVFLALLFRRSVETKYSASLKEFRLGTFWGMALTAIVGLLGAVVCVYYLEDLKGEPKQPPVKGIDVNVYFSMDASMYLMIAAWLLLLVGLVMHYYGWKQEIANPSFNFKDTDMSMLSNTESTNAPLMLSQPSSTAMVQPQQVAIDMNSHMQYQAPQHAAQYQPQNIPQM